MNARRFHPEAGVSLVETLVALAVAAVMASAVFVIVDLRPVPARDAAERMARAMAEARETAMLTGEPVGFAADPDGGGWRFFRYADDRWVPVAGHPAFEPVRFSDPDLLLLAVEGAATVRDTGEPAPPAPQIWFDPAGFDAPFVYELSYQGEAPFRVAGGDGVRIDAPEAGP
ncbi:MAG: GspH/FimT family protein [Oceanicaulis sp.]